MAERGKWCVEMVAARLEEAAETLNRLPMTGLKPREYGDAWPTVIHDAMDAYGWDEAVVRLGPPSAEAITRMDEVMDWLRWMGPDQVRLVWLRAGRVPWRMIGVRYRVSINTVRSMWVSALATVAANLNSDVGGPPGTLRDNNPKKSAC